MNQNWTTQPRGRLIVRSGEPGSGTTRRALRGGVAGHGWDPFGCIKKRQHGIFCLGVHHLSIIIIFLIIEELEIGKRS